MGYLTFCIPRIFNPNSRDYVTYLLQIEPASLSTHLITLCSEFYTLQCSNISPLTVTEEPVQSKQCEKAESFPSQCNNCLTRYDKQYGDSVNGINKDVEFTTLTDYCCPVCEAPKEEFSLIQPMHFD